VYTEHIPRNGAEPGIARDWTVNSPYVTQYSSDRPGQMKCDQTRVQEANQRF
jgi:hypothetical protein